MEDNKEVTYKISLEEPQTNYYKLDISQTSEPLEILSLKINQTNDYQFFNADYGVLVGRVLGNDNVGIPNAKLSIFIPLTDEDEFNPEIKQFYPFKNPKDKDNNGKRYNLLPRVGEFDIESGFYKPIQPFGTFPTKTEIIANENLKNVYKKYYKYTAVTNQSGDYMLYGIPTGVQTVHLSVDVTDIGSLSMNPLTLVNKLGYSPNLFSDDGTKIKESTDLNDLPNIETREVDVEIIPFWGDENNYEIGITRQDFKIRTKIVQTFTIFGSHMTMGETACWGDPNKSSRDVGLYNASYNSDNTLGYIGMDVRNNRLGQLNPKIYYFPNTITDDQINNSIPLDSMVLLDESEYYFKNDQGQFVLNIPCNRRKIITDEFGNEIEVDPSYPGGIFTRFEGLIIMDYEELPITIDFNENWVRGIEPKFARGRLKIPQVNSLTNTFSDSWARRTFNFEGGKFYTVAQFLANHYVDTDDQSQDIDDILTNDGYNIIISGTNEQDHTGSIKVGGDDPIIEESYIFPEELPGNTRLSSNKFIYDFPTNGNNGIQDVFGGNWINMMLFFPQFSYGEAKEDSDGGYINRKLRAADIFYNPDFRKNYFIQDNNQEIVGGLTNTKFFMKTDNYKTDFVEVPLDDLNKMLNSPTKGFTKEQLSLTSNNYKYRLTTASHNDGANSAFDQYQGTVNGGPFFSKGILGTDCVKLLKDLNLI